MTLNLAGEQRSYRSRGGFRQRYFFTAALTLAASLLFAQAASASPLAISVPLDSQAATSRESNFGDLVADAALSAAPGAQFALVPAGELRPVVIASGQSSTEKLANGLWAGADASDTVVVLKLTGAQALAALTRSLSRAPSPFDGYLQVSGLKVRYDLSKNGQSRIVSAALAKTGAEIKPTETYKVAMSSYLANGALGYFDAWAKADPATDMHISLVDAVTHFALAKQPLAYQMEGRITAQ